MDPHTTSKKGRSCRDCHNNPRTLGLGTGTLTIENNSWIFTPAAGTDPSEFGYEQPLDAFVTPEGFPLVNCSRPWLRPFNSNEILRILNVGLCLPCHEQDKGRTIWNIWKPGNPPAPCRFSPVSKFPEAAKVNSGQQRGIILPDF